MPMANGCTVARVRSARELQMIQFSQRTYGHVAWKPAPPTIGGGSFFSDSVISSGIADDRYAIDSIWRSPPDIFGGYALSQLATPRSQSPSRSGMAGRNPTPPRPCSGRKWAWCARRKCLDYRRMGAPTWENVDVLDAEVCNWGPMSALGRLNAAHLIRADILMPNRILSALTPIFRVIPRRLAAQEHCTESYRSHFTISHLAGNTRDLFSHTYKSDTAMSTSTRDYTDSAVHVSYTKSYAI